MATNITAGNSTNGAAISSDNTGTLDIKTGTGAGTTAISIDASQNVAIPGTLTVGGIPAGGNYELVRYTSPSTWDATAAKAAGLKAIKVTVVGAGGNGGSVPGAVPGLTGGGGGGGGAAIEYVPVSNITPGNKTVTAGAGTNSFGPWGTATPNSPTATVSATAGAAGNNTIPVNTGGAGGVGSGGSLNMSGSGGGATFSGTTGNGGSSILGGGAASQSAPSTPANGTAGGNYGGGGSGSRSGPGVPSPATTGGAGAPGVVIIEEFY